MKKSILLSLILSCLFVSLFAQQDSAVVTGSGWTVKKIARRVQWKQIHVTGNQLFNANQNINIIEISPRAKKIKLAVAYSDSLDKTSTIGLKHQALAAINGSFFKMRGADPDHPKENSGKTRLERSYMGKNRSVVYMRVNDSLIAPNLLGKDSVRKRSQQGVVAIKGKKELDILAADPGNRQWENELAARDVLSSGPMMIAKGRNLPIPNDDFCNDRHPRTAVGKKADGTIILLVVDGRNAQAAGMSIPELQKTMYWLGCTEAINLDGGGSTAMYIKGQPDSGVVSNPSDNKQFDHAGEREVANAIIVLGK